MVMNGQVKLEIDPGKNGVINTVLDVLRAAGVKIDAGVIIALILMVIFMLALHICLFLFFQKLNKSIFRRLKKKRGNSLALQFIEKVIALAIIVLFVVLPLGGDMIRQHLLGSATVIAAIVGLAANDVIKDMCAGLQISIYKPFDVGSRVQLEDGRAGIVEKLTLRHVVLKLIDTTRLIIPNSKIDNLAIVNYSSSGIPRSFAIRFPLSYDSDPA
jgi:small conductance mechanosensitive channel